jgi:membrane-anchored protein YejM (alkaline phosphatase superfamily)
MSRRFDHATPARARPRALRLLAAVFLCLLLPGSILAYMFTQAGVESNILIAPHIYSSEAS